MNGAALLALLLVGCVSTFAYYDPAKPHRTAEGFRNNYPHPEKSGFWKWKWAQWRDGLPRRPEAGYRFEVAQPNPVGSNPSVTWVGHATLLVQLDGVNFLTDPTWARRTGPFGGLVGVGRYTPPGIRFEDLPRIDFVLISHDHYDHLDEPTVRRLEQAFDPVFVVPMGIKSWLADRGIDNAIELEWGQSVFVKGVQVICTPAQHGSGRTLADQGRRLWSSWAVLGSKRFYFGGDTGYFRHFKEAGDAYGPFDLAALPIGSYTPRQIAKPVHISPEEALQAQLDLRAAHMIGIHWGTFGLARERYDEPPERIAAEIQRREIDPESVWILKPGETAHW